MREFWMEEMQTAFRDVSALSSFLGKSLESTNYPLFIPRSFAQRIKEQGPDSPLWKSFVPHGLESSDEGLKDPIGDRVHQKTPHLIHRYLDRALFLPTTVCSIMCRYCFRKNELLERGKSGEDFLYQKTWDYLREHEEISEVIFSGGDPLILSDQKLTQMLLTLSQIPHIKMVRFHSRVPVILPSRLTPAFKELLEAFSKRFTIRLAIHTNLCEEWGEEALEAISSLKIPLLSQSVLLKGVNDTEKQLLDLFSFLSKHQIKPYYLHHPDQVKGGMHFYLSVEEGLGLFEGVKSKHPEIFWPKYVIDPELGTGKIEVSHFFSHFLQKK